MVSYPLKIMGPKCFFLYRVSCCFSGTAPIGHVEILISWKIYSWLNSAGETDLERFSGDYKFTADENEEINSMFQAVQCYYCRAFNSVITFWMSLSQHLLVFCKWVAVMIYHLKIFWMNLRNQLRFIGAWNRIPCIIWRLSMRTRQTLQAKHVNHNSVSRAPEQKFQSNVINWRLFARSTTSFMESFHLCTVRNCVRDFMITLGLCYVNY